MENNPEKVKAILLCGGKGERLRPLTTSVPKPLIPIKENPILSYILEHLCDYKVDQFLIAAGYKAQDMVEYCETKGKKYNTTVIDSGNVDIIKRIISFEENLDSDFMVLYGDTLSDVNIAELINFHFTHPGRATVTLWPLESQFGIMNVGADGVIDSYQEKPRLDKWINIGYFYFEHSLLDKMKEFETFPDFLDYLIRNKELNGYKHNGVHITVNTQKELAEAEKNVDLLKGK